jgi:hypothetical protein
MMKFNIHLEDEDWFPAIGGWRCDALLLPGASLEALYHDGMKTDTKHFDVETHFIRWSGSSRPKDIIATLSIDRDLHTLEQEKLSLEREKLSLQEQLERDKLSLERQKTSLEIKWKFLTAIGAVIGSILSLGAAHLVGSDKSTKHAYTIPTVQTYAERLLITEKQCLDTLSERLEGHGLHDITLVRRGIYATKDNYNVFVSCDTDLNAIFLVVSGPDNTLAKKMREEIKALLPE